MSWGYEFIIIRIGGIITIRTHFCQNKIRVSGEGMDRVYNNQNGPDCRKLDAMQTESQTQRYGGVQL